MNADKKCEYVFVTSRKSINCHPHVNDGRSCCYHKVEEVLGNDEISVLEGRDDDEK